MNEAKLYDGFPTEELEGRKGTLLLEPVSHWNSNPGTNFLVLIEPVIS